MPKPQKSQLQSFLADLPKNERELTISTLDLQLMRGKPLSEDEKKGKLEAQILKLVE